MEDQAGAPPGATDEQQMSHAESAQRITAADVERAKAEKEAAMSKLMDDMEVSVETQGQYFVKLGNKVPLTQPQQETGADADVDDQRVLILNALGDDIGFDNRKRYVEATMVTRDGIKIVGMNEVNGIGDFGLAFEIIRELKAGSKLAEGTGFSISESGEKQITLGYMKESGQSVVTNLSASDISGDTKPFSGTPEEFQSRVKKSIDQTKYPRKAIVEENTADAQLATSAADMIRTLPPRA